MFIHEWADSSQGELLWIKCLGSWFLTLLLNYFMSFTGLSNILKWFLILWFLVEYILCWNFWRIFFVSFIRMGKNFIEFLEFFIERTYSIKTFNVPLFKSHQRVLKHFLLKFFCYLLEIFINLPIFSVLNFNNTDNFSNEICFDWRKKLFS